MRSSVKTERLYVGGMTCISCQNRIEKKLKRTAGIKSVNVSYSKGTVEVDYDSAQITRKEICRLIQQLDYQVLAAGQGESNVSRMLGFLIIIAALYFVLEQFGVLKLLAPRQLADRSMGYGMLFVIGLFTSVHCIAMCGGINLTQSIAAQNQSTVERLSVLRPGFLYNLGRVISYTFVGFLVGALGSVFTFSNMMQGILKLIAGLFMIIMGINMLNIFPWLRRLNPRLPQLFGRSVAKERDGGKSPLVVGLLNGLMPCGPLQAMQIYALSTGNPFAGAFSMFMFSLGTFPLMFGFGALVSALKNKYARKIVTAGAVLVVVLGLSMLTQGAALSGLGGNPFDAADSGEKASAPISAEQQDGTQVVRSTLDSYQYPDITVRAGQPVKWVIDAPSDSINGCNNRFFVEEYGIEHTFTEGENIIEFTPTAQGTFQYSCWMGMIRATITVVE